MTLELVRKRTEKLEQLWQVLDFPQASRREFQRGVEAQAPSRRLEAVNGEIKRLEVQLPLLEVITRREFVQHRIQEEERGARGDAAASGALAKLRADLARLTEQLKAEIPRHEQRFGTRFLYRGVPYLDVVLAEGAGEADASLRTPPASAR